MGLYGVFIMTRSVMEERAVERAKNELRQENDDAE